MSSPHLLFFPFPTLATWFGQGDVTIALQLASLYDAQGGLHVVRLPAEFWHGLPL